MRLIRYQTKPGQSAANAELVQAVFAELRDTKPDGLRYTTLRLADQVTFFHLVEADQTPSPLFAVKAFGEFQAGIAERCAVGPVNEEVTVVGSYRFFAP
jgi:hypothetical protein